MKKLLMFTASWCGPCKAMKSIVAQLDSDIEVEYIDIEDVQNSTIVDQYHVLAIPTFISFKDGTQLQRKTGGTTLQGLRNMFEKS